MKTGMWSGLPSRDQEPFRRFFRPLRRPVPDGAGIVTAYTDGRVTLRSNRSKVGYHEAADLSGYQGVARGDFVVHGLDILRGSVGVSDADGAMSSVCIVSEPMDCDPRFMAHVIRMQAATGYTRALARGVREGGADFRRWDTLAELPLPVVALAEQRRIADFLDDRVARIDQIIAGRRRQAGIAVEAFSIANASVFENESRRPLKTLLTDVTSGPRGWGDLVAESGTKFARIANLSPVGIELRDDDWVRVQVPPGAEAARTELQPGDVLLSITAVFGEVGVWREGEGAFSQHVARLRPIDASDSEWIAWWLQSIDAHEQYKQLAYGGTKVSMGLEQVRNLSVPAMSSTARTGAAQRLNEAWTSHDRGLRALNQSIVLLQEYKQSLITAAVTGELDVTTASSRIPE